jgi:hypothetical protein
MAAELIPEISDLELLVPEDRVIEVVRHLELVKSLTEVSRVNPDGSLRENFDEPGMQATYAAIDNFRRGVAYKFGHH